MKYLLILALLLAACEGPRVYGTFQGETKNHLAVIQHEDFCSTSAFDNSRCVVTWYCAVKFDIAAKGQLVSVPESYCKDTVEEIP